MHKPTEELFEGVTIVKNPTLEELRDISLNSIKGIYETKYGNLVRFTKRKARKADKTYIIAPQEDADKYSGKIISREKANEIINQQRAYIKERGRLIQIDAYQGNDIDTAVAVQWLYTDEAANVAAMQKILAFSRDLVESEEQLSKPIEPVFRLIMTPDCPA